jgi:CelD/BcsL family acetyltransferase involved in cellulose biosynthesis
MRPPLRLELGPVSDVNALAGEWQALETRSQASFFLSWTWISTWLDSIKPAPTLVRARAGQDTVALAIFAPRRSTRHGILRIRQIHLHEAGDPDLDRIAIEYNGFLAEPDISPVLLSEIFRQLRSASLTWDECVLPGVPISYLAPARDAGLDCHIYRQGPCFTVDLVQLREQKATLMQNISRNTRSQLRRALVLAEAEGPLSLKPAEGLEEALVFFAALKKQDRWLRQGQQGAFTSALRDSFHRRLIGRALPRGEVEMLQARAGGTVLGYLYQFNYRGRVLAYQAGYPPGADNRHRPGLVMHYLAIERAKAAGMKVYDFLAGEARYKRSLASATEPLVWCRVQKPLLKFGAERLLRRVGRYVRSLSTPL